MAIADGTAGAWVATTTRNPTVTLPSHSTGDMLIVRMGWKSATPTTDVAVCNTSGWAKLGQRYNGGGVSSNGGGGVLVAAFYKVATSGAETNPVIEFDDATAPTPGCYAPVTYTKGAGEAWVTPVWAEGDIAAATSYTSTMGAHVSATSGDMLESFAVTNDNTTLTVPTVTQASLTLDTVTEYPATALSSTTSNDISADGRNRLATAGTSSAAAVVSGTNSVADPGAAAVIRLRVSAATTVNAEVSTATGAANNAAAGITPTAAVATGTGSALDATVTTGIIVNAGVATGTGAANNATALVTVNPGVATGTGAALTPSATVAPTVGIATATGAGLDATGAIVPSAGVATGTGAALTPSAAVTVNAEVATGTGAALDATVTVGADVTVNAEVATATGAANNATLTVGVGPGVAQATGLANDATVTVGADLTVNAEVATGTGTANQPSLIITPNAGVATALAAAYDASGTVGAFLGLASGTGQAYDATITVSGGALTVNAELASGSGQAYDATIDGGAVVQKPRGGARLRDMATVVGPAGKREVAIPPVAVTVHAGVATGTGAAHDATITWNDDETALALLLGLI